MKGKINVTSKDIFPLIKKFMYNEHDIFIREIVSNAVDASQKLITLSNANVTNIDTSNLEINVIIDKAFNTITVSDNGIGMTEDEIEKYINQIAFSGANDFIEKYSDTNIIGHFGLGFYSSFMVSDSVDIITKSYKEDSSAYKWSCNGTIKYTIEEVDKDTVGTDVVMHISEEFRKEYLDFYKLKKLLKQYSEFLPIKINIVEKFPPVLDPSTNEFKTKEDRKEQITSDNALWTKQPSTLTDDDYIKFYKELYPERPEPLFWIHLNIDMPFTFTGILYFPDFDPNRPIFERNHLSLYCNRVYVTNNIEGILPDYLSLLHGIIDSPDIPLNVSRSFLQSDPNVKKISTYISNKVISSLKTLMKKDREEYEKKWNIIKLFINLGVVTVPDLYDKVKDILLVTDTDNINYTLGEYYEKVKDNQTDKNNELIYLYTYNKKADYPYIEPLNKLGYNVLEFNNQYSSYEIQQYEVGQRERNIKFKRIDADTPEHIIEKDDNKVKTRELNHNLQSMLITLFESTDRKLDKVNFNFDVKNRGKDETPIIIVVDEYFRRIKEMSMINNQGYFLDRNDELTFIINSDSKIVKKIIKNAEKSIGEQITNINTKISELEEQKDKDKDNEETVKNIDEEIENMLKQKQEIISEYAKIDEHINELIDIALLQHGLLTGENLSAFIKRSIKMIEK